MRETHTPGPWVVGPYHSELPDFAVGLSKWEDGTACGCSPLGNDYLLLTSSNLTEANARLIAASPELLQACRQLAELDLAGTDDSLVRFIVSAHQNNAKAAIAKATVEDVTP